MGSHIYKGVSHDYKRKVVIKIYIYKVLLLTDHCFLHNVQHVVVYLDVCQTKRKQGYLHTRHLHGWLVVKSCNMLCSADNLFKYTADSLCKGVL